jgi:hypothetical protein
MAAPIVKKHGTSVIVPKGASFTYLDRNSRQASDCEAFGYAAPPVNDQNAEYCWVLASYHGVTGWLPVLQTGVDFFGYRRWSSALCSYKPTDPPPRRLVSDDGSPTGCAELSLDLRSVTSESSACFPGNAQVTMRDGASVQMSQLQLGDKVAVRREDGSVAWEPVYAFGHRDELSVTSFIELTATLRMQSGSTTTHSIQVD